MSEEVPRPPDEAGAKGADSSRQLHSASQEFTYMLRGTASFIVAEGPPNIFDKKPFKTYH